MLTKYPIISISLFSVILIAVAYFLLSLSSKPEIKIISYSSKEKEKPKAEVKERVFDFGKIKVSDTKVKEFTIKNIGSKPLQLYDVSSSCGCTTVQVIYNGRQSDKFSMHSQSNYTAEITPQTQAKIKVTYQPFVMPVSGLVAREAYISTNDSSNPKIIFKIKAFVQ